MVDKNVLRAEFSSRLHEALTAAGIRQRGRGVDVHEHLKSLGVVKTTQAISKWLNGEAIPEADSMAALAQWLGVRREWLEYGVKPKETHQELGVKAEEVGSLPHPTGRALGKVPLISWSQAGSRHKFTSNFESTQVESWLSCPVPISESGYALKVRGDSMTNPGPGRSYPEGCIIFVDPELKPTIGDRIIASIPRANEATFKVLVEDAGVKYLRSVNPQYPILPITEGTFICGKVIGTFIPE
ncbi:S24 family peptidase [Pseudomonas protegens]|uniref:LexA family protein n=1 Tax=Pseudomonas protegens TaxID=380021 RepID=UPI00287D6C7E|nr:S24 family peptidase [Pseudomonas protegens]MDS9873520.1 S24 family peptidase [Pseudomonas protegens]